MPVNTANRKFERTITGDETSFLLAAKDDLVKFSLEITNDYSVVSTSLNSILISAPNQLQAQGFSFENKGFQVGDSIVIEAQVLSGSDINETVTILDINGSELTHSGSLSYVGSVAPNGDLGSMTVRLATIQHPEQIDVVFNLIENSQAFTLNSLVDGEQNICRFNVNGMAISDVRSGVVVGNKSGGAILDLEIERLSDVGSLRRFKVSIDFANWLSFDEQDLTRPNYYLGTNTIKPVYRIKAYRISNNPNSALVQDFFRQNGNVGWYNENYNQGNNPFVIDDFTIEDDLGNPLSVIDHTQPNNITIKVTGSGDFVDEYLATFYLVPFENYKNKLESWQENTFYTVIKSSPESYGILGGLMTVSDVVYDNSVTGELELSFKLTPNADFTSYVNGLNERWYRLSLTTQTDSGTVTSNDRTTLLIQEAQMQQAPIIAGETDVIRTLSFFSHELSGTITSLKELDFLTEDDILVKCVMFFEKGVNYGGVNVKIQVANDTTGERFDLFSRSIPFGQYPTTPSGVIAVNYSEQLGFELPNPDRNILEILYTGVENSTNFFVSFRHTFLNNWRYWLSQPNALLDFLNVNLTNNGLNQEWVRYAVTGFTFYYRIEVIENGVANWIEDSFTIGNYDSSGVTTVITLTDLNDNPISGILSTSQVKVKALHTFPLNVDQTNAWGWIAIRPFQGEPRRLISSAWNWSNNNLPLRPLQGETTAVISFPSANQVLIECLIDGSFVSGNNSTIISRIFAGNEL